MPNSQLIEVTFEAEDPQLAAQIVNAHLQNYIEQNFRSKYDATTQASTWLSSELEELRIKVEKSGRRANRLRAGKPNLANRRKAGHHHSEARRPEPSGHRFSNRAGRERSALSHGGFRERDALPAVRDNAVVQDLLKRKDDIDSQYADALRAIRPEFSKGAAVGGGSRKKSKNTLDSARKTVVESVRAEYNTARSHVELAARRRSTSRKTEANDQAEKLVQYHILQHDADSNKQLYDGLLQKLKEAGITAGLRSSNIRVVDPALAPTSPSRPQKARNIMLGFLVGLVGGIGLAIFREYLDNTVKSPDDIEDLTGLPVVGGGALPAGLNGYQGQLLAARHGRYRRPLGGPRVEMLSYVQPKSQISEAFRALRTSLLLVPGGPSSASDPGDKRVATRRKNDGGGEPERDAGAVGRPHATDGFRPAQTGRSPRAKLNGRKRRAGLSSYLAGVSSLGGCDFAASDDQQSFRSDDGADSAEPGRPAFLASHARSRQRNCGGALNLS